MGNIRYKGGNYTKDSRSSYVQVEPLSVTENGTYTAESGKAYNPVSVSVGVDPLATGVTFFDYDGTVIEHYTKDEFLALSEMPANPTHERLVAQGWNWNLADAKEYVRKYGLQYIGQMYTTASGATEIDIELEEGRLHPYLGLCINGTVTIDWGDESETDEVTGSSTSTLIYKDHIYSSSGFYTIKIYRSEETVVALYSGSSGYSDLFIGSIKNISDSYPYNSCIKNIYVSDNFELRQYAFVGCRNLTTITISKNIININPNAVFGNCQSLKTVIIPSGITKSSSFGGCYALKTVSLPKSITAFGDFRNDYNIETIMVPEGITTLSSYTFSHCSSLKTVILPESITAIGSSAFEYCALLDNVQLPKYLTSIGNNGFYGCSSLKSITIPDTVLNINSSVFSSCTSLKSIVLPNNLVNIYASAFEKNPSLKSITIPNTVTTIDGSVFLSCYNLSSIILPNNLTTIGIGAFNTCMTLKFLTIPNTVTDIKDAAFIGCQSLESITLPTNLTKISNQLFSSCFTLRSIEIPESVTSIGSKAFSSCQSLSSVILPKNLTSIGLNAFNNCYSLGFIKFTSETPPTVQSTNAWNSIPTDCKILVPQGTMETYKATANMPNPSIYTYEEYTE